jgi:hypothetical protein
MIARDPINLLKLLNSPRINPLTSLVAEREGGRLINHGPVRLSPEKTRLYVSLFNGKFNVL